MNSLALLLASLTLSNSTCSVSPVLLSLTESAVSLIVFKSYLRVSEFQEGLPCTTFHLGLIKVP